MASTPEQPAPRPKSLDLTSLVRQPQPWDHKLSDDLRVLARFIRFYCAHTHRNAPKQCCDLVLPDGQTPLAQPLELCPDCRKLLMHALVKRSTCPMNPKPMCKHCPNHCYHPRYREQIREVMKVAGRGLVLRGRVDYLLHLIR